MIIQVNNFSKSIIILFVYIFVFKLTALADGNPEMDDQSKDSNIFGNATSAAELLQTDENIDITSYHIDIDVDIENESIDGSVYIELLSVVDQLSEIKLNLHHALDIHGIWEDTEELSYNFENDIITITLSDSYDIGETVNIKIEYGGKPALAPGENLDKGLRFDYLNNGAPAIASYSTPYLSHYWFPCKDGTADKADKVFVDITVPENYKGHEMYAVSNGVLKEEIPDNGKKTFKWEHHYPIAPFYIMIAVSDYELIEEEYSYKGNNFPMTYYVFPESKEQISQAVTELPDVFNFFIDYIGDYPFADEAFGITQIAPRWSIETQTNILFGLMGYTWLGDIIHEISHSWFGNSITNETWNHIWLNEGFATYAVALYYNITNSHQAYYNYIKDLNRRFNTSQTLYLEDDSDYNNIFVAYYYEKGAWFLHMLRGILGDDVFLDCISSYAQSEEFRYKTANTEEFKSLCEDISGKDLDNFFDQWVYDVAYPIYSYELNINEDSDATELTLFQLQNELLGAREIFEMDMEIEFHFDDGTSKIEKIFNDSQAQIFSFDFEKNVTKVDIDPKEWIIREIKSREKNIISFDIEGQISSDINEEENSILVVMPYGTDLSSLTPIIEISDKAEISPESNSEIDFSQGEVSYTVTAEDASIKTYTVNIETALNSEKQILNFTIDGQVGGTIIDNEEFTLLVEMPNGAVLYLSPIIEVSEEATVSPESESFIDFSEGPVEYTVSAQDGSTQIYLVTVEAITDLEVRISSFTIENQIDETIFNHKEGTILIMMPIKTNLSELTPFIELEAADATIYPESGVAQNFTSPVLYTVTAQDNSITKEYYVTVRDALSVDLNYQETENILISPNPSKGEIFINSKQAVKSVEIYSINGSLLKKVDSVDLQNSKIDLSEFGNGIMLLKIITDNNLSITKKVLINN